MELVGLDPTTSWVRSRRPSQLSYSPAKPPGWPNGEPSDPSPQVLPSDLAVGTRTSRASFPSAFMTRKRAATSVQPSAVAISS